MVKDPRLGCKVVATVTGVKGKCNAGHRVGESFEISCHNPAGLCGLFYHRIFPKLADFPVRREYALVAGRHHPTAMPR